MSAEKRGASQNKTSFNHRAKAGEFAWDGMAPDFEPQDLPANRPALATNLRMQGGGFTARGGLVEVADLQAEITGMTDFGAGGYKSLFMSGQGNPEVTQYGKYIGSYNTENSPNFQKIYAAIGTGSYLETFITSTFFTDAETGYVSVNYGDTDSAEVMVSPVGGGVFDYSRSIAYVPSGGAVAAGYYFLKSNDPGPAQLYRVPLTGSMPRTPVLVATMTYAAIDYRGGQSILYNGTDLFMLCHQYRFTLNKTTVLKWNGSSLTQEYYLAHTSARYQLITHGTGIAWAASYGSYALGTDLFIRNSGGTWTVYNTVDYGQGSMERMVSLGSYIVIPNFVDSGGISGGYISVFNGSTFTLYYETAWSGGSAGSAGSFNGAALGGYIYYLNGNISSSIGRFDGVTFTPGYGTLPTAAYESTLTTIDGHLYCSTFVSAGQNILRSTDGLTWETLDIPTLAGIQSLGDVNYRSETSSSTNTGNAMCRYGDYLFFSDGSGGLYRLEPNTPPYGVDSYTFSSGRQAEKVWQAPATTGAGGAGPASTSATAARSMTSSFATSAFLRSTGDALVPTLASATVLSDGSDATYIYSTTLASTGGTAWATCGMSAVPANQGINAVVLRWRDRNGNSLPAGETNRTRAYIEIGGSKYYAPWEACTDEFSNHQYSWFINPASGTPWTTATADEAKAGLEMSSVGYGAFATSPECVALTGEVVSQPVTAPVPGVSTLAFPGITALCEFDGLLFVSVYYTTAGTSQVYKYDGTTFTLDKSAIKPITGFGVFRETLVGGTSDAVTDYDTSKIYVRNKAGVWSTVSVGAGIVSLSGPSCVSYQDRFYLTYPGETAIGRNAFQKFDGTTLTQLTSGTTGTDASADVSYVTVGNGFLYFVWHGTTGTYLGKFDGTTWTAKYKNLSLQFFPSAPTTNFFTNAMTFYRGNVAIAYSLRSPNDVGLMISPIDPFENWAKIQTDDTFYTKADIFAVM